MLTFVKSIEFLPDLYFVGFFIQELCAAFEAKEETYKCLMQKGQQMLARCPESAETNVEQDINNLKEKWESVQTKLSERKVCFLHKNRSVNHVFRTANVLSFYTCILAWSFRSKVVEKFWRIHWYIQQIPGKNGILGVYYPYLGVRAGEKGRRLFHRNMLTDTDDTHFTG